MLYFSKHASDRLERVRGILSREDVEAAVRRAGRLGIGETAIKVRVLPRSVQVTAADGSYSSGNVVYVVFRRRDAADQGAVATIELRHAAQGPSKRWARVINLV